MKAASRKHRAGAEPGVVVAGGGSAGLCLALALKRFLPDLAVEVVDARPSGAASADERASAIAAAARRMLEQLDVWHDVAGSAQPILSMEVTDSRTSDAVRPVFLTFDGTTRDGEPFAHMVPNAVLLEALRSEAESAGVRATFGAGVERFETGDGDVRVHFSTGEQRTARLLVAADGVRSRLRAQAGIRTVEWSYPQIAIVCTVAHERPHHGVAVEHFLPSGPFAILPLSGNRSSLVWTERKEDGERLLKGDEFVFEVELERRFGHKLGKIELEGRRQGYPLGLILARDFVRPRFALLGDAAHGIHPIAGQGLNLGFRDVAALAETVVDAARLGLDIGALDVLQRYERWRRYDTFQMGVTTDVLNRLFSNDFGPLRAVRDIGLGIVDRLPPLKRLFIGEAAGLGGELPKLLSGEPI
ncbi:ubiquinone biosynthesis hydroxylase [Faunimonas sp. B44]|uniref:ubiquinone biosynthesis hydroxylase n=1 Tax=Faunimonas sp. B44 TaxID=3461493 RepID=UPI004043A632